MSSSYLFYGSILEKCGNFWENGRFSGRIWPDWGNTARADMAGLGCIGLKERSRPSVSNVVSVDVRLTTALSTASSLVNVTNSI